MTNLQLLIPLGLWRVDFSVSVLACSPVENIEINIFGDELLKDFTYSDDPVPGVVSSLK